MRFPNLLSIVRISDFIVFQCELKMGDTKIKVRLSGVE